MRLSTAVKIIIISCCVLFVYSCSTTTRVSEEDPLYTGIKEVKIADKTGSDAEKVALVELDGALAFAPNNSLFGSSTMRSPLPIGLWIYNSMDADSLKGIKKWFYNTFSAVPKTMSSVTPDTRVKVATNVLQNYGYFNAAVDYRLITSKRDPRKQKIAYDVTLGHPYTYDSIKYLFNADSLVHGSLDETYLHEGNQFSVADLQSEKTRLTTIFHNNGYYYYRPDYIKYFADSINSPGKVKLLVAEDKYTPARAKRQWKIGKIDVFFRNNTTTQQRGQNMYNDTIHRKRFDVAYQGKKVPIRIPVVMRNFKFWTGGIYSEERVNRTLAQMARLKTFSTTQFTFAPADSTDSCSVLNVRFEATVDKMLDTEFEFNFTQKSNSQIGPYLAITLAKPNAFRNGEKLSLKLRGSYYWQVRGRSKDKTNNIDSYDYGADLSLEYPWIVFPYFLKKNFYRPTASNFSISFTRTNIAKAFRYNQFSLSADYKFYQTDNITHIFTPFKIDVMDIRDMKVDSTMSDTQLKALVMMATADRLVPSMQYNFIYDNTVGKNRSVYTNFNFLFKEAGTIFSAVDAMRGKGFTSTGRTVVGMEYEQFLKVQAELRNRFVLTPKSCIATRVMAGYCWIYGNSQTTPFSERYYAGGAYSVRAFPARSLGPGQMPYSRDDIYITHGGGIRLELNAEYRFPLFGNLNGALFVDAGNVWARPIKYSSDLGMDYEEYIDVIEPYTFKWKSLYKDLALGTGFGLRYDLEFLVIRFDVGVAIHAPYETSKKGYYNIPRFFKDGVGLNLAVGYPF